jgi:hypothetical protein
MHASDARPVDDFDIERASGRAIMRAHGKAARDICRGVHYRRRRGFDTRRSPLDASTSSIAIPSNLSIRL